MIPKNQRVSIEFEPAMDEESANLIPLFVMADRLRLFEVISNLVRNSVKSLEAKDDGLITIRTQKKRGDSYEAGSGGGHGVKGQVVEVSVRDKGTGISEDMHSRLFTRFASGRGAGGIGLGLYISKNIVEAHGGRMWAENNTDGAGTTFTFILPLAEC